MKIILLLLSFSFFSQNENTTLNINTDYSSTCLDAVDDDCPPPTITYDPVKGYITVHIPKWATSSSMGASQRTGAYKSFRTRTGTQRIKALKGCWKYTVVANYPWGCSSSATITVCHDIHQEQEEEEVDPCPTWPDC